MINKVGWELPSGPVRYASKALGGNYLPKGPQENAGRRLFPKAVDVRDEEGDLQDRRAEAMFALVPDVENTYNKQAVAVVLPAEDGTVSVDDKIGWLPDGRCATVQPRLVSLIRATGGFPVVLGFASYDFDYGTPGADMPSWMDPFTFRVQLCSWEQLHYAAQKVMRETEPDIEQPWVTNRGPRSDLSTRLYASEVVVDEPLVVTYEIRRGSLIAAYEGEVLTDISSGGRDFFDTLHQRVIDNGPIRGWARPSKGGVDVWHEGAPPAVDPSGKWW